MVDDVPLLLLMYKLQKLKLARDRFSFQPLINTVDSIINEITKIWTFLEQLKDSGTLMNNQFLQILYSAEYIIESFLVNRTRWQQNCIVNKITKMHLFASTPGSQVQLSRKLKEIEKGIRAVSKNHGIKDMINDPNPQALRHFKKHHYCEMPDRLIGREDTEEELVHRLINDGEQNLRVISLVSEESLGKTALARKVYDRLDIRQHFQCRLWIHVPEDFTYTDLLLIIISQIPIGDVKDVELMNKEQLSEMVFKFFMGIKNFLIVLDNVTEVIKLWQQLVRPFADKANGSRVILTTRKANEASKVDPWSDPVHLQRLNEEDSWELFLNKVGTPEDHNGLAELNSFKEAILKICRGLPPAIVLLGGVLSTVGVNELSSVIDHLSHLSCEDDHSEPLRSILALSYSKLPLVLRPCFLYLALFPKTYEIPIRRLLHLWLAEGFVQTSTSEVPVDHMAQIYLKELQTSTNATSDPEDMALCYLKELVCRNMIEIVARKPDGSPKTCRLPCFLHEIFLLKAKHIGFFHVHRYKSGSPPSNFNIRRLADQYCGVRHTSVSHTHDIFSYLSFEFKKRWTSNKKIEKVLKRILNRRIVAVLKVFDLEKTYRPVLPDKLGQLQNLKYIGLRWTGLYSCPASIGDLPCLETLDLKYTNITILPSSIWKAKKLRHLYMNEVSIDKPTKEPSIHLQTLVGLHIGAKHPEDYGLNRLTNLRKLKLTCNAESVEKTVSCIAELSNLQTLKLRSRDSFGLASDIVLGEKLMAHRSLLSLSLFGSMPKNCKANLPQNLKTLSLSMLNLGKVQMKLIGQLSQLNILCLLAGSFSDVVMEYIPGKFSELRVLKLWMLGNLKYLSVKKGGLPKLEEMEIRGCKKLEKVRKLNHLHSLKELVLTNMPPDFVADVRETFGTEKLLVNEWTDSFSLNFCKWFSSVSVYGVCSLHLTRRHMWQIEESL